MTIYILNIVSILIYAYLYSLIANKYNAKKIFIILFSIQLILILSLRHQTVGVDVTSYLNFFQNINPTLSFQQFMEHRFELGYKLINKVLSLITINGQIFLVIMAIICIFPVGRFVLKYSKMPFLSLSLYIAFNFYAFTFSGLRQGIAYGIILISYDFIVKRQFGKYVICVLLASLFHQTALIFLPAYFLVRFNLNKRNLILILAANIGMFLLRKPIYKFLIQHVYHRYEVVESNAINWMTLGIFIIIIGLIFYKRVIKVSPQANSIYVFMIIGVSLMMFATVGTNSMRIADYYYMFVIIFIPEVLNSFKDKGVLIISGYLIVIFVFMLHLWFLIYSDTYHLVPYKFFWSK